MSVKQAVSELNSVLCSLDYANNHFGGGDPTKAFDALCEAINAVEFVIGMLEKSEGGS